VIHNITYDRTIRTLLQYNNDDDADDADDADDSTFKKKRPRLSVDWNKPSKVNPNQPSSSSSSSSSSSRIDPNDDDDDVFEIGSPRHLIETLLTWNATSDRELQQKQRNRSDGKFMTSITTDYDDGNGNDNDNDGRNMTPGDIYMVRLCVILGVYLLLICGRLDLIVIIIIIIIVIIINIIINIMIAPQSTSYVHYQVLPFSLYA
jgi:hypothetical protein